MGHKFKYNTSSEAIWFLNTENRKYGSVWSFKHVLFSSKQGSVEVL